VGDLEKKTILIVDDHADTRLLLSAHLKAQYRTVFAADALQAISVALKERPDAILLDLGLPGGNGLIVLQRLQSNTSLGCIPVIIVTADDPGVAEGRAIEAGAVAFLQKPVDHDKLIAAVQQAAGAS
jgi:two-component system sensor histidine kinase ChiS